HGVDSRDGGLLIRTGVGLTAAGLAAFGMGFISQIWLPLASGPAKVEPRAEARRLSVASIHPKLVDPGTAAIGSRTQLAGPRTRADLELASSGRGDRPAPWRAPSPSGERFSFDGPGAPTRFSHLSDALSPFDERFGGGASEPGTSVQSAAAPPAAGPRVAAAVPMPRPAPRSEVAQAAPKPAPANSFRLASATHTTIPLA